MNTPTHGRKLKRPDNNYIRDLVDDSGLGPLVEGTHSLVNKSLLSAFTERWHKDTSSFHLPVGEMTITLDYVSNLVNLPITDRFFFLPLMGKNNANQMLVTALGVVYYYLELFRELTYVGQIAYGAVALAYLSEQLDDQHRHDPPDFSLHHGYEITNYNKPPIVTSA
ncbi:Aminotransferase-like, plant mobile domain [Sesbania bispinosa]|nr:Aminotransferase-like, plant mobile domain [Sesbania bispinosa]